MKRRLPGSSSAGAPGPGPTSLPDLAPIGLAHINGAGWNASVSQNVTSWFGGTLDVSGAYARPTIKIAANLFGPGFPPTAESFPNLINASAYTFMYGPTFSYRKRRFDLFGRVLLGAAHARASVTSQGAADLAAVGVFATPTSSQTKFAIAAGGGTDFPFANVLALRLTADWIHSTFSDFGDDRQNNIRVSAGLVYRIGRK
jgi:hypothetical protein